MVDIRWPPFLLLASCPKCSVALRMFLDSCRQTRDSGDKGLLVEFRRKEQEEAFKGLGVSTI